jgi:hypothetical protein
MREPVTEAAAIAAEIARIRSLAPDALRRRWRAVFGLRPAWVGTRTILHYCSNVERHALGEG